MLLPMLGACFAAILIPNLLHTRPFTNRCASVWLEANDRISSLKQAVSDQRSPVMVVFVAQHRDRQTGEQPSK